MCGSSGHRIPTAPARRPAGGFTLVEMVVTMVVIGVLLAVAAPIFSTALQAYAQGSARLQTLTKARYATERIARELREVTYNAAAVPPQYSFTVLGSNTVTFTRNDNGTNRTVTITSAPPTVRLSYSTPVAIPAPTLTDELAAAADLAFTYYDRNGGLLVAPTGANVAAVQISLTLTKDGVAHTQQTRVTLRNN